MVPLIRSAPARFLILVVGPPSVSLMFYGDLLYRALLAEGRGEALLSVDPLRVFAVVIC